MKIIGLHREVLEGKYTDKKGIYLGSNESLIEVTDELLYRILCDCHIQNIEIIPVLQDGKLITFTRVDQKKGPEPDIFADVLEYENRIIWKDGSGTLKSDIAYTCHLKLPFSILSLQDLFFQCNFDRKQYIINFECPNNCTLYGLTTRNSVQITIETIEQRKYLILYPFHGCGPHLLESVLELIKPYLTQIDKIATIY